MTDEEYSEEGEIIPPEEESPADLEEQEDSQDKSDLQQNQEESSEEEPLEDEQIDADPNQDNQNSLEEDNVEKAEQVSQPDYLDMARRIQADFENFRRHADENVKKAKIDGQVSVLEVFLPCLDTFKEAKKSIVDENVLKGVEMIENKIMDALNTLGVEKLESIGQVYDPHIHNVIAVMKDETKENDIILDEYQAGYKFNDKVIRYAKVIVNKKED